MSKRTPMMQQYADIKSQYKDAFLFFRLGDFYELFYDDAIKAAQILEITLTKRDSTQDNPIPMCGVPHHSVESYIKKLVDEGYKVAICEQVEDPKDAVGVVKREVVKVVTPGTIMDSTMLSEHESNFIAGLSSFDDHAFVIAYNDLSTGESKVLLIEDSWDTVIHQLYNDSIKEIVISSSLEEEYQTELQEKLQVMISYEDDVAFKAEYRHLCDHLNDERYIKGFSRLLNYLHRTQKRSLDHIQKAEIIYLKNYLNIDMFSKRNLELTESYLKKEKHGSLLWVLDKTVTAMGTRKLKAWLERPLIQQKEIEKRLSIVSSLYEHFIEREELRELLKTVYDLERLVGRIAYGNVNARDLVQLRSSLENISPIKDVLSKIDNDNLRKINEQITVPTNIINLLKDSIVDDPPISITEGSIIKDGFNEQLDTYRDASRNGKEWIASLEQEEREITKIRSLKIGFNRVFGYYIEVTKPNLHLIPEGRYERKQTLTNAERFITPELKEKELLILEADEKSTELEHTLFLEIRDEIKDYIEDIQFLASQISKIDVLQSFALVSEQNNYTKPRFVKNKLHVKNGRHPVIEKVMKDGMFVPNDIELNDETNILLITGPNMSGKSTYMRQLALTVIMAQIGCFVPSDEADLLIFDQIFTRIGAADDLVAGQSTFMVEMLEANYAISHATENSLILLDEIGRGTSTYDGMALAQAIIEYIHDHVQAKTLFSTHYHELTDLEDSLSRLKNVHVRAEEDEGDIIFLHQVQEGSADESYGIHVAKLADLPIPLIQRASEILKQLEYDEKPIQTEQLSFFVDEAKENVKEMSAEEENVLQKLKKASVIEMTPLDALNFLHDLQKKLSK
ncbi:MAG TPA: DNA mismatch repair protein MutS [Bacillota bacterium]|nr:DNA mismatch repair protein MutS [Bacillota bacterium]